MIRYLIKNQMKSAKCDREAVTDLIFPLSLLFRNLHKILFAFINSGITLKWLSYVIPPTDKWKNSTKPNDFQTKSTNIHLFCECVRVNKSFRYTSFMLSWMKFRSLSVHSSDTPSTGRELLLLRCTIFSYRYNSIYISLRRYFCLTLRQHEIDFID